MRYTASSWVSFRRAGLLLVTSLSLVATVFYAYSHFSPRPAHAEDNSIQLSVTFEEAFAAYNAQKVTIGNKQYYKMQDMTAEICSSVPTDEEITLIDVRDNKTYNVMKMVDGGCWMLQDLRIGDGSSTVPLSSQDTNLTTKNNWVLPLSNPDWSYSASTPSVYYSGAAYFNWLTATAGGEVDSNHRALNSICAYGWELPNVSTTTNHASFTGFLNFYQGDYSKLHLLLDKMMLSKNGAYISSTVQNLSQSAQYILANEIDASNVYHINFSDNGATVLLNDSMLKADGNAIRCVSNPDIHSASGPNNSNTNAVEPASVQATYVASRNGTNNKDDQIENADGEKVNALGVEDETNIPKEVLAIVANVESLIRKLPSAEDVTKEHSKLIEDSISAYEDLSDFERSLIDEYLNLKYLVVVAAYNRLDQPLRITMTICGITVAAIMTGVIVVVAARKKLHK